MPSKLWRYVSSLLVLVVVLIPLTRQAKRTYPKFDDAHLELILKENGLHSVQAALVFRPLHGWILQQTVLTGHHIALAPWVQFFTWLAFGVLCMAFWITLFPDKRRYAPIAGCLGIAPILVKGQLGVWLYVIPEVWPVILSYAACLLLWAYITRTSSKAIFYLATAALLTFSGGMLAEYGLLASVASCILLLGRAYDADKARRTRVLLSVATIALAALAAHLLYVHTANDHPGFSGVSYAASPSVVLTHLPRYASMFVRSFWFATLGATAQTVATLTEQSTSVLSITTILYATVVAALLALACRKSGAIQHPEPSENAESYRPVSVAALLLAACVTLAPAVLLHPVFASRDGKVEEMSTRYFGVAVPLVIALVLRLVFTVMKPRYWFALPILSGLLAGYAVMQLNQANHRTDQMMFAMGPVLRPWVESSPDQTVAFVPDFYARDDEMMYKVSADWPASLSHRFYIAWDDRFTTILGAERPSRTSDCANIHFIDRNLSTLIRRGPIGNLLWVEPLPQGGFRVEPYCLGRLPLHP